MPSSSSLALTKYLTRSRPSAPQHSSFSGGVILRLPETDPLSPSAHLRGLSSVPPRPFRPSAVALGLPRAHGMHGHPGDGVYVELVGHIGQGPATSVAHGQIYVKGEIVRTRQGMHTCTVRYTDLSSAQHTHVHIRAAYISEQHTVNHLQLTNPTPDPKGRVKPPKRYIYLRHLFCISGEVGAFLIYILGRQI